MRVLRNFLWFVVSAVSAAACTHASAQTAGFNDFGSWSYEWANGKVTGTLTGPNGQTTHYPMGPSAVGQTTPNGSGGVTWSKSGPVNLSGAAGSQGATATLTATRTATAAQIAKGALSRAKGGPLGIVGGLVVSAGLEWAIDQWVTPEIVPDYPYAYEFRAPGFSVWRATPELACVDRASVINRTFVRWDWVSESSGWCRMDSPIYDSALEARARPCDAPGVKVGRDCVGGGSQSAPATDQDIESAIETGLSSSPTSAPAVVDEVLQNGGDIEASAPAIGGPASVTSPAKTTTSSTGSQTSQTTYNITYNNNSYSYSSSTTTTTKDAEGNTTDTTTEDTSPEPGDVEVTPSVRDTSMPPVPTLYERKYPDGIIGVWETRKAEFQETGFSAALDALLPDIPDGGGCPQFSLPGGTIAGFAFPGGNLGPPCWVWPWVKVVIVITSLFLARSLVFGG